MLILEDYGIEYDEVKFGFYGKPYGVEVVFSDYNCLFSVDENYDAGMTQNEYVVDDKLTFSDSLVEAFGFN